MASLSLIREMRGEKSMNLPFLKKSGTAKFVDHHVVKANEIIIPWDGGVKKGFGLIGVPFSKSSISHSGAAMAPQTIRNAFSAFSTYAIEEDIDVKDCILHDFGDILMHVTDIVESQKRIEETIFDIVTMQTELIPIILGGDHSTSASSIKAFMKAKGKVGVIQFDAHHDLRNLQDGGPSNGTPFRTLIESGAIEGKHLVQIGIRNFANSRDYRDYAEENSVTIYTMKDVREKLILPILKESIEKLEREKVDIIYISLDMDVLDQAFAPGCPAIGPGGMDSQTLLEGIEFLAKHPLVQGLDIVEIDPTLDVRDMTSRVAAYVILQFLKGKE